MDRVKVVVRLGELEQAMMLENLRDADRTSRLAPFNSIPAVPKHVFTDELSSPVGRRIGRSGSVRFLADIGERTRDLVPSWKTHHSRIDLRAIFLPDHNRIFKTQRFQADDIQVNPVPTASEQQLVPKPI